MPPHPHPRGPTPAFTKLVHRLSQNHSLLFVIAGLTYGNKRGQEPSIYLPRAVTCRAGTRSVPHVWRGTGKRGPSRLGRSQSWFSPDRPTGPKPQPPQDTDDTAPLHTLCRAEAVPGPTPAPPHQVRGLV